MSIGKKKYRKDNQIGELKMKPEYLNEYDLTIGGQIANIRKLRSVSQQALADEININRVSLANVEIGKRRISMPLLYKICETLGYQVILVPKYNHELKEKRENAIRRNEIRIPDEPLPGRDEFEV